MECATELRRMAQELLALADKIEKGETDPLASPHKLVMRATGVAALLNRPPDAPAGTP